MMQCGGKPSTGTPKDRRLRENKRKTKQQRSKVPK